jgi:hypothetical protein
LAVDTSRYRSAAQVERLSEWRVTTIADFDELAFAVSRASAQRRNRLGGLLREYGIAP